MTRIFLSYARGDDGEPFDPDASFVARLHQDLTAAGVAVWFDRVSMPSRALTFHQEIRDAIAACDRLVLVVGQKAAESLYVRQEWQFAYLSAEKVVTPILRRGDYTNVPDELKLLHCEDFRDDGQYDFHLKNLVRQLAEPAPSLGKLIGVPSLPPHFLLRTDRLVALRDALRADLDRPVVITGAEARVGMHGMGGIGKSVLAATLARDRKIREAFPDGIVWVGLGPLPTVAALQRRVHKDLGGDGAFQTEHEGRVKLRDTLKNKRVLLILDDVWRHTDVDWFDVLGPRCRAMITTRDAGLLTSLGGMHHQVELLSDRESLSLLAQATGVECDQLPREAAELIAECGRLPLAVALCGGLIRHGFAWTNVLEQLQNSRIDRIKDPHAARVEHESIWNAIDVSINFLSDDEQTRFLELAVFPPDEATLITALRTLWSHTAGFEDWDTDALVIKLRQRSLLELSESDEGKAISLHDLVYDYVHRASGDKTELHQHLLEAYRCRCPDGWHVDPPNDGYFFTHLRHHLIKAGRARELADLLLELQWLEAKNAAGLAFDLPHDFRSAVDSLREEDELRRILSLLDEALRRDIHFIARHSQDYPQALFQCMWNTAWWYDCPDASRHYFSPSEGWTDPPAWARDNGKLCDLMLQWRRTREQLCPGFPWLRTLRPPSVHLGTGQYIILRGQPGTLESARYSSDSTRIVTGSWGSAAVWDARTGAQLLTLHGHVDGVTEVAFSHCGTRIASCGWDRTVRIWNSDNGSEVAVLRGHEDRVTSISWSPDGTRLVSGSYDGTIRLWDASRHFCLAILRGHQSNVNCVAYLPNGDRFVSGSFDHTIRVWDANTGEVAAVLSGETSPITAIGCSPDGKRIVSGSQNGSIRLWDVQCGVEVAALRGHDNFVTGVSYSSDGSRIASSSWDQTVRIWDAEKVTEIRVLRGHNTTVNCVNYSPDGRWLVIGADDMAQIWDANSRGVIAELAGGYFTHLTCAPDGTRAVSLSWPKTLRVWDTRDGTLLNEFPEYHGTVSQLIDSLAAADDGSNSDNRRTRADDAASIKWVEAIADSSGLLLIAWADEIRPWGRWKRTAKAALESAHTAYAVTWFPQVPKFMTVLPRGCAVAGEINNHLQFIQLERTR